MKKRVVNVHPRSRQDGLTLIEGLIALLVLSIGLVGMGALMLTSLQNVHSSAQYSTASAIVLDLEERVWEQMTQTVVTSPGTLAANGCLTDGALGGVATAVETSWTSQASEMAADWTDAERFNMPDLDISVGETTTGGVDRDGDGANDVFWKTIPVTLTWTEGRFSDVANAESNQESYTSSITMACRPVFL